MTHSIGFGVLAFIASLIFFLTFSNGAREMDKMKSKDRKGFIISVIVVSLIIGIAVFLTTL